MTVENTDSMVCCRVFCLTASLLIPGNGFDVAGTVVTHPVIKNKMLPFLTSTGADLSRTFSP